MKTLQCPFCNMVFKIGYMVLWDELGEDNSIQCPSCEKFSTVHWEEVWHEKTGEEEGWFFLDKE